MWKKIAAAILGIGTGFFLAYLIRRRSSSSAGVAVNLFGASVNPYAPSANYTTASVPPSAAPVSVNESPYFELIESEAGRLAFNANAKKNLQVKTNIPKSAFDRVNNPVLKDKILGIFRAAFQTNPLEAWTYPIASKYESNTLAADLARTADAIASNNAAASKVIRYWNVDFSDAVKWAKLNSQTQNLANFLNDYAREVGRYDEALKLQAIQNLRAQGYKFIEYP